MVSNHVLVDNLMAAVEARHIAEKDRWPTQRVYLNAVAKVSIFLRDCNEIIKQLLVGEKVIFNSKFNDYSSSISVYRAGERISKV